ncbi:MAG: glycosyltransferase family 2 protein [Cyclobacteriaceae bacterium]
MNKQEMKNSEEPLVSVVLSFYNEKLFLPEAIQSVLSQDYDHWELLLVDDGSTDDSTELAKAYAAEYPGKITYVDHPYHQNKGLSASRNEGIKKCRGTYVAFLDADDIWMSEKLRFQVDIFKNNPGVTVLLESSLYWNSWKDKKKADTVVPVGAREGIYKAPQLMLSLYPLGKGAAPCPSGIMVHRAVLRRCVFEELFRGVFQMYEDQAFLCKVYLKETVYVSAACHNKYRQRRASLVSAVHDSGNYHKVRSYYLYWFRDYLHDQPFRYRAVERLLRKAQMPYREPFLYKVLVDLPKQGRKILIRLLIRLGILNYSKSW